MELAEIRSKIAKNIGQHKFSNILTTLRRIYRNVHKSSKSSKKMSHKIFSQKIAKNTVGGFS
jgi:hypothetical protein